MTVITFVDTETTGLKPEDGHKIIEICMLVYTLENELLRHSFCQRINPKRSIDSGASAVHGILLGDLITMGTFATYEPHISKILDKTDLLVAHNLAFDANFLVHEYASLKKEMPSVADFCTMENGRFATFYGKSPTLAELCFATGVEFDHEQAHGALYDTSKLAEAFFAAYKAGYYNPPLSA